MPVYTDVKKEDLKQLLEKGFFKIELKSQYEVARMQCLRPKLSLVLYNSGKLVVQGSDLAVKDADKFLSKLGKKVKQIEMVKTTGVLVGSDEALKGDTFGGLVVAAVKLNDKTRKSLMLLGVQDSKKITDGKIHLLAEDIIRIVGKDYSVRDLLPEEYNKFQLTPLLNRLHLECGEELGGKQIVDQYPGCNLEFSETKAESKYVEVAAASIIARSVGLKQLAKLSLILSYDVPKGSTHVKDALEFLKKSKKNPGKFVKLHFKNVRRYF
jgi:ribonuclease HIII